jgi:tRNA-2-methylthio-N6-dimethylallyladenosine synthase
MSIDRRKYFIKTFGCQANEADSEKIAGWLEKKSYQPARKISEADLIIINTCSVRESAENRVYGLINNLAKKINPRQKIILTGCLVGSAKGERKRISFISLKKKLPHVYQFKTTQELIGKISFSAKRSSRTRALIPIMEGCNHFCSYCVVPYSRGPEKSRPLEEIVCEAKKLAQEGYSEILLLGQNVNAYGKDFSFSNRHPPAMYNKLVYYTQVGRLASLLRVLHQIPQIQKISFLTSNPWDLTDDIIEVMKLPKIDRYLHLPVQSGDNTILKKMNRGYTVKDYLSLVRKLKESIPEIKIGTDIIVGFPGETKTAFENTVSLCQKIGFVKAYVSRYSPRPGTAAFKLEDDVSFAEKKRRWKILDDLINKKN